MASKDLEEGVFGPRTVYKGVPQKPVVNPGIPTTIKTMGGKISPPLLNPKGFNHPVIGSTIIFNGGGSLGPRVNGVYPKNPIFPQKIQWASF